MATKPDAKVSNQQLFKGGVHLSAVTPTGCSLAMGELARLQQATPG